jgi:hypothetical protein
MFGLKLKVFMMTERECEHDTVWKDNTFVKMKKGRKNLSRIVEIPFQLF